MKQTHSATLLAHDAHPVIVEATMTKGLPSFSIVGLASSSIQESKERVKSALLHNEFVFPPMRITLNLSPSDVQKDGTHFDLPIALLIALQKSPIDLSKWAIFGELGLDGSIKGTHKLFALILSYAINSTITQAIVPAQMAQTLKGIPSIDLYPVSTLQEAISFLEGTITIKPLEKQTTLPHCISVHDTAYYMHENFDVDFSEVRGQHIAKRAALIAAAGGHNLLMQGNPGSGKSMIAKRMHTIMPPVSHQELLTIAKQESLDMKVPTFNGIRPMRAPHHSATPASIFGGGSSNSKIGEVGLAHFGILFFDELPHFSKNVLEALREPLEDRRINIARVNSKITYETNFLFVAAMNPCPCGNLLSTIKECRCSDIEIKRYQNRLSDPFLDRIDLFVTMQESSLEDKSTHDSKALRALVVAAFKAQKMRNQTKSNANLTPQELSQIALLNKELTAILEQAVRQFKLTARSIDKVIKVARTIADINAHTHIEKEDLLEALSFRRRN